MTLSFISLCSGIEAVSVATTDLGWRPLAFAEVDPNACGVLRHHYPEVPNLGDITTFAQWPAAIRQLRPDVVVAGTPCQSFSVAGLRHGMADPRGNLALQFLGIVAHYQPRWVWWENVPGVLSSWSSTTPVDDLQPGQRREVVETSDLGCFLDALELLGYGWHLRSLDAQFFGVAQRRERVFVVGHLGDWRPSAAVLLEPDSMSGGATPSRPAGEDVATILAARSRSGGGVGPDTECPVIPVDFGNAAATDITGTLTTAQGRQYAGHGVAVPWAPHVSPAMKARDAKGPSSDGDGDGLPLVVAALPNVNGGIAHTLRASGFDGSEDGTGRGVPLVIAFQNFGGDTNLGVSVECAPPLKTVDPGYVSQGYGVRRLTPTECERLQGFPDGYTKVRVQRHTARCQEALKPWDLTTCTCKRVRMTWLKDGPRYKLLGNSMAVPVMRWIGHRITMVHQLLAELRAREAA